MASAVDSGALQQQLEFYFSESNLRRDRYIRQKIDQHKHGFFPVSDILTFNRIKQLRASYEDIIDAIRSSHELELDKDNRHVRPAVDIEFRSPAECDTATIYVEGFKLDSTQDSLKEKLQIYGNVQYISLPRHRATRALKGFAFIEFDNTSAAQIACSNIMKEYEASTDDEKQTMLRAMPLLEWRRLKSRYQTLYREFRQELFDRDGKQQKKSFMGEPATSSTKSVPGNGNTTSLDKAPQMAVQRASSTTKSSVVTVPSSTPTNSGAVTSVLVEAMNIQSGSNRTSIRDLVAEKVPRSDIAYVDFRKGNTKALLRFVRTAARDRALRQFPIPVKQGDDDDCMLTTFYLRPVALEVERTYMQSLGIAQGGDGGRARTASAASNTDVATGVSDAPLLLATGTTGETAAGSTEQLEGSATHRDEPVVAKKRRRKMPAPTHVKF
eukprot:m.267088 g.267088  ORF g.267088 m.267088 type:complete len:440 (-) comp19723_c0_seq1:1209-2528(-)